MNNEIETLLKELYEFQVVKNHRVAQINKDLNEDFDVEYNKSLETIKYLEQRGLVKKEFQATGFIGVTLTAFGIDYVKDNLLA